MGVPFRLLFVPALGVCLLLTLGCSNRGPTKAQSPLPTAKNVIDLSVEAGGYPLVESSLAEALQSVPKADPVNRPGQKPLHVLALSGGGQYGSYVAGILCGWQDAGYRPDFDVCTGISSGALIAMLAYLGPKYDPELRRVFTTLKQRDLFRYRPALYLIRYRSIASSDPIKRQIDTTIDEEFMDDLRIAHQSGRRLFVGTMHLQSRRLVIWDIGALACSGRPDANVLVKKVILAATSISGLVPPVEFEVEVNGCRYVEEHVDGGGASQVFVRFGPHHPRYDPAQPGPWLSGSQLYLFAGGKLYADTIEGDMGFLNRVTSTVSGTLYALYRTELHKMYSLCAMSGMQFNLVAVPQEKKTAVKSMTFEPEVMQDLFALGYSYGYNGIPWRHTPPGTQPGEEEVPRAGLEFLINDGCPVCPPTGAEVVPIGMPTGD